MTFMVPRKCFLLFMLLARALALPPIISTLPPTPGNNARVQIPPKTQPRRAVSTFQSTTSISENQGTTPSALSTAIATVVVYSECDVVYAMISSCNSVSPGFTTFSYIYQTPCPCYPNMTVWMPEIFDDAVTSRIQEVSAIPPLYSRVASLERFCTRPNISCITDLCTTATLSASSTETLQTTLIILISSILSPTPSPAPIGTQS
jgi:hypothetical protein